MVKIKMGYHDLNLLGGNRIYPINYDEIINSIPNELGDRLTLANDGNDVRSLRVNGGILRIDEFINHDRYLKLHFVKLRDTNSTKSLDNRPGVQRLELPAHEFVSKHSVVVIDKLNDKVMFQNNRNVISEKMFCEFINFFWHNAEHTTNISIAEIPDNPAEFADMVRDRVMRPKSIEVTSSTYNRVQDVFDVNNPFDEAIRTLSTLGGYTVKMQITKSRGGEEYFLDENETDQFVTSVLENGNNNYSKANVVYYDDDDHQTSILDLIGNRKKAEIQVETNEDGDFNWRTVAERFIDQYNLDF